MSIITSNTTIKQFKLITTLVKLPSATSEADATEYVKILGEYDHLVEINQFRNMRNCAQPTDLLLALLSQTPVYANQILLGYGYTSWGSGIAIYNRAQRTEALRKVGLTNKEKLIDQCRKVGINENDTILEALGKMKVYNIEHDDFEPLKSGLDSAICAFIKIYK